MATKLQDQPLEPSYQAAEADLSVKKADSEVKMERRGLSSFCSKLRARWHEFWWLLCVHWGNTAITLVGAVFAASMLASVALAPAWFLVGSLVTLLHKLIELVGSSELKLLRCLGYTVIVVSLLLLMVAFYMYPFMTFMASFVIAAAAAGYLLFVCCGHVVSVLVKTEVRLASMVAYLVSPSIETTLDPEECARRFEFPELLNDSHLCWLHTTLTRRHWALVFYYAIPKVAVGVCSASVVVCTELLLPTATFTLGRDPYVGSWIKIQASPSSYVIAVAALWVLGTLGLQVVARLSVKLTALVSGPWNSDQLPTIHKGSADPVAPSTPEQESPVAFAHI